MSTTMIHNPIGNRATALEKWVKTHQDILSDRQARVLAVRDPSTNQMMTTLRDLKTKKVSNTLQEERHRLDVNIPKTDLSKVNAYVGCSNCGKRAEVLIGKVFTCTTCSKKDCVASPRVTFNCEVADGTGTLAITTFTEDTEKLFRMHVADIFHPKHSDDVQRFEVVQELLRTSRFIIEVGPKPTLLLNKVLQWTLKKLIFENEEIEDLVHNACETTSNAKIISKDKTNKVPPVHSEKRLVAHQDLGPHARTMNTTVTKEVQASALEQLPNIAVQIPVIQTTHLPTPTLERIFHVGEDKGRQAGIVNASATKEVQAPVLEQLPNTIVNIPNVQATHSPTPTAALENKMHAGPGEEPQPLA